MTNHTEFAKCVDAADPNEGLEVQQQVEAASLLLTAQAGLPRIPAKIRLMVVAFTLSY